MNDDLLNDWQDETDPLERARKRALADRDYAQGLELLAGLLMEYGREPSPVPRPVIDLAVLP
jgi:hypothetical protein